MKKGPSEQNSPEADLWEAIARYSTGESPPEEAERVREWLDSRPTRAELVAALDSRVQRLGEVPLPDVDVETALARVKSLLAEPEVHDIAAARPATTPAWQRPLLRAAAVAVIVLGAAVVWRSSTGPGTADGGAPAVAYETGVGQTDSISLADGTLVVLAPGSKLALAQGYGQQNRQVELNGEAFFDVKHDARRSFIVRAGGAIVRDLGTAFTVRTGASAEVRVAVTQGTVVLHATGSSEDQGVVLNAGDRGVLANDGRVSAQAGSVTATDLAWTRGALVFDDASLDDVAEELRRWYGIDLQVQDATLAQRHVTASFQGEPVQQVLDVIALALGARIERNGNTAVLRNNR